ncbi:uncharacterized protein LOC114168889 [Vigna unguiculata]|uniref:uncharacterized protein LOC114168889 n=1 Tax=Vigna unguiculata TaxID=3917 RepID=UPI0010166CB6|nr:uncharacterized protein LOC114168889 [Vigna unguiculata]
MESTGLCSISEINVRDAPRIATKVLWTFTTINIHDQLFVYVDRRFAAAFENELTHQWTLFDSFENRFVVSYNMDKMNPKLTDEWKDLEKTYNTQIWDSYVQFRYVGNSTFQITVFIGEFTPKNMKAFLDTASVDPGTSLFAVTLTQCQAKASHLDLNVDFADVIKSLEMEVIYLVARLSGVECKLLVSQKNKSTKLGQGWRKFCAENRLKEGDRLVFEVDHVQKQPIVEVYINGCYCDVAKSIDLV